MKFTANAESHIKVGDRLPEEELGWGHPQGKKARANESELA